jgi:hypothetical protein
MRYSDFKIFRFDFVSLYCLIYKIARDKDTRDSDDSSPDSFRYLIMQAEVDITSASFILIGYRLWGLTLLFCPGLGLVEHGDVATDLQVMMKIT